MSVAIQRPQRGSRISSFYPVKSLPSLASLDSAFQLQEYISLLIRLDPHDVETIVAVPSPPPAKEREGSGGGGAEDADAKTQTPETSVDEACWIYEQLRRLAQDLSHPLITVLQNECTRESCPEMKAGEWLYLCVAHGNDGAMEQCCAIDYIIHTLDSATALLNSPRAFPSRLSIPQTSFRHFASLARRLGRVFAHAYFHHRDAFAQAEAESSLYARFQALVGRFDLVPQEFLVIPPSRAGDEDERDDRSTGVKRPSPSPPRLNAAAPIPAARSTSTSSPASATRMHPDPHSLLPSLDPKAAGTTAGSAGGLSPRRTGRSRTDTMVLSEGASPVDPYGAGAGGVPMEREGGMTAVGVGIGAEAPGAGERKAQPQVQVQRQQGQGPGELEPTSGFDSDGSPPADVEPHIELAIPAPGASEPAVPAQEHEHEHTTEEGAEADGDDPFSDRATVSSDETEPELELDHEHEEEHEGEPTDEVEGEGEGASDPEPEEAEAEAEPEDLEPEENEQQPEPEPEPEHEGHSVDDEEEVSSALQGVADTSVDITAEDVPAHSEEKPKAQDEEEEGGEADAEAKTDKAEDDEGEGEGEEHENVHVQEADVAAEHEHEHVPEGGHEHEDGHPAEEAAAAAD